MRKILLAGLLLLLPFPALAQSTTGLSYGAIDIGLSPVLGTCAASSFLFNNAGVAGCTLTLPASDISGQVAIGNGGTGASTASTGFNALSPMTTAGDIIYGGVGGTGTRLPAGTSSQVLIGGATESWGAVNLSTMASGTLQAAQFPALTGDITTAGGALATTLATVNANVGTFADATVTVNGKGLVTAVSSPSGSSAPAYSGTCTTGTPLGNNTQGSFLATATCASGTVILTMTVTAPHGWACSATDLTTGGVTLRETAYTATTVTFAATMTNADLVIYQCSEF